MLDPVPQTVSILAHNSPPIALSEVRVSGDMLAKDHAGPRPAPAPLFSSQPTIHQPDHGPYLLKVAAVVSFYVVVSISMIMVNKAVLNQAGLPLTFLWGQLFMAVVLLELSALLGLLVLPPVSWPIFRALSPLIAMNVVGLTLNTFCLYNIDAVLYQVARSLILPITVGLSQLFMADQRISWKVAASCAITFAGFLIGMFGERTITVSTIGVVFGVLSSVSTAVHSIVIKKSFNSIAHNGAFDLVFYNNLFSALFLLPSLLLEVNGFKAFAAAKGPDGLYMLLYGVILSGVTGLLINVAGFLQIKVTSPISHTVSSAARGVLQTLAARALLGEAITIPRSIGISVILIGSCLYSFFKSSEISKASNYRKLSNETEQPR